MSKPMRFIYDDTDEFGRMLTKNWRLQKPKTVIYYRENTDPNQHDFRQDEVALYITESHTTAKAAGIGYDSLSNISKIMHVYVTGIDRRAAVEVANEVMRICMENRRYPFAEWDMMIPIESQRVFPAYRYFQWLFGFQLLDVVKEMPHPKEGC